jgi:hypothetical protein
MNDTCVLQQAAEGRTDLLGHHRRAILRGQVMAARPQN